MEKINIFIEKHFNRDKTRSSHPYPTPQVLVGSCLKKYNKSDKTEKKLSFLSLYTGVRCHGYVSSKIFQDFYKLDDRAGNRTLKT
jgi:hypothetical protein